MIDQLCVREVLGVNMMRRGHASDEVKSTIGPLPYYFALHYLVTVIQCSCKELPVVVDVFSLFSVILF